MGSHAKSVTVLFLLIRTIIGISGIGQNGQNVTKDDVITVHRNDTGGSSSSEISSETLTNSNLTKNETFVEFVQLNVSGTILNSSSTTEGIVSTLDPSLTLNSSSPDLDSPFPPSQPQKLTQTPEPSPLSSLLQKGPGSSESLQNFLKTRGFSFAPGQPPPDPNEINRLLARLKPKQGRFDPVLLDIINNSDRGSGDGGGFFPSIFGNLVKHANKVNSAANQNLDFPEESPSRDPDDPDPSDLWAPSLPPRRHPPRGSRNRFSSKFSKDSQSSNVGKNETLTTTTQPPPATGPRPLPLELDPGPFTPSLNPSPQVHEYEPFSHITDPNLRNHRLYDWELEKNFTTLDQAEDLLAQSSEVAEGGSGGHGVITRVKPPPGITTSNGWIPRPKPKYFPSSARPVSMEGTQFDSSGDLEEEGQGQQGHKIPVDTFVQFPTSESSSAGVDFDLEPEEDISQPFNLLRPRPATRPREPLRESSTENLVFSNRGSLDKRRLDRYRSEEGQGSNPGQGHGVRSQESQDDSGTGGRKRKFFRPSPADKVAATLGEKVAASPPVFVDPDQDFFTSTIRTSPKLEQVRKVTEEEPPSFIRPMRRLPSPRDHKKGSGGGTEKRKRRPVSEEAITDLDRDPRPYPEDDRDLNRDLDHRDRPTPSRGSNEQDDYTNSNPTRKSDRILVYPGGQGQDYDQDRQGQGQNPDQTGELNTNSQSELRPTYYNFYPVREFGPASNEAEFGGNKYPGESGYPDVSSSGSQHSTHDTGYPEYPEQYTGSQYDSSKSGVVLGHNGEQIYAGGYDDKFHHPLAGPDQQPEYSSYAPNSNEGWLNTYWILGGLIALSALTAFVLPTLLNSMGRTGKIRNDLQDENLEYTDDTTSPGGAASGSTSTSTFVSSLLGGGSGIGSKGDKKKKKPKPPSNLGDDYDTSDPTANSDLWTEIKGVYNDVVKIVRGDYGGIVDKLSGGYKDKDKDNRIGPNIVYRDDLDDDLGDDDTDHDKEEDDFDYEAIKDNKNKNNIGNRKGKAKPKGQGKIPKKNRNITSSINYVVSNSSPGSVVLAGKHGAVTVSGGQGQGQVEETSRAVPQPLMFNDTMATFYLGGGGPFSSSSRPFSLFTSPSSSQSQASPGDPDSFMGEWAKVQLIGS